MADLLFICFANMCRSPMAEHLARDLLAAPHPAATPLTFASAGTHAIPDRRMHPYAAQVVTERGGDPVPFRSRPLARAELVTASLILTASRRQRAACVELAPAAVNRAFTLRQFGRLAAEVTAPATPMPLATLVTEVLRVRGRLQPAPPGADDLADPIGGPLAGFRACADQISADLSVIGRLIGGPG